MNQPLPCAENHTSVAIATAANILANAARADLARVRALKRSKTSAAKLITKQSEDENALKNKLS